MGGEHDGNRSSRRWRTSALSIPIILLAGLCLAQRWTLTNPDAGPAGATSAGTAPSGPPSLPSRLVMSSASAPVDTVDPRADELATRIRSAVAATAGTPAAGIANPRSTDSRPHDQGGPAPPDDTDADLRPRMAPPSTAQLRRLNLLRWRQPGKHLEWRTAPWKPTITYLSGRRLEPAAAEPDSGRTQAATTARRFLENNSELLALADPNVELALHSESRDALGFTQLRFHQRHAGLPVWPCGITVQVDPAGHVTLMTGSYVPTPSGIDPSPTLPADAAERLARRHALETRTATLQSHELLVHAPIDGPARLAWRIDLRASRVKQWDVIVDAHDGTILNVGTRIATTSVTGTGTDLRGVARQINLWRGTDNLYYMVDASKPMFVPASSPPNLAQTRGVIAVLDLRNSSQIDVSAGVHNVANAPNGPWRQDAVSASVNLGRVYDFFRDRFGRDSVNGTGGTMIGIVNLDDDNAYSDFQTQTMIFGNRDQYAETLDVVAHEMTHSVISTTSNLVYQFQSGALNEAFSDILGEGCEAHFNGGVPDWKMGTSLRRIFRAFDDPGSILSGLGRPYPSRFSQFEVLDVSQDKGGVHINSSIINHGFYLLAVGMPDAIGLDDALQIYFRALTTKLNPQSQFIDCRLACIASADELFGPGSIQSLMTAAAFDRIEIFDQAGRDGPAPLPPVDALDSTLFIFPSGGSTFLGRREALFNDGAAGVFLGANQVTTPVMPGKKPAVSGDGSYGLYVRPNADASFIDTETGASTFLNFPGQIESVGLSADGTVQAYVLRTAGGQPDKRIYVFDTKTNETKTYTAIQPLTDQTGDGATNTILSVDALDLTPDGRYIYYDALNRISFPGGGFVDSYSIYFIDRASDTISSLIPPIPGVQVGNPSLGKTRPNLLTFDVVDANGVAYIYAADLASGAIRLLTVLAAGTPVNPGWPGYSGDDTAIVYTNYTFDPFTFTFVPHLESQPVTGDGLTPNGNAFAWLSGSSPSLGLIYRRGAYAGLPILTVTTPDPTAAESGNDPGTFRITRTGLTDGPLPFSFTLTGGAANAVDYAAVALAGTIPQGSTSVDVVITPFDDGLPEGDESIVLTLVEALDYARGDPAAGTITLLDNDALDFAGWAATFGLGANDHSSDPDEDGRATLLEYALGTNPLGRNTIPHPLVSISDGRLVLTVLRTRAAPDVTYRVEVSSSLTAGSWVSGPPHTTVLEDTPTLLRVRSEAAAPDDPGHFIRLRVSIP